MQMYIWPETYYIGRATTTDEGTLMVTQDLVERAANAAHDHLMNNNLSLWMHLSDGNANVSPELVELAEVICLSFAKDLESLISDCDA